MKKQNSTLSEFDLCLKKALSLLSYADNNRRTLYTKLVRQGYDRNIATQVVEECVSLGYINEIRQIERIILSEVNISLRGEGYVVKKLISKGYNTEDIRICMSKLTENGEINFADSFSRLCQKRGAADDEEKKALAYKFGYKNYDLE